MNDYIERTLRGYLSDQIEWSKRTFGEGKRTGGITKHIEKELAEVRSNPSDLSEWIDIIILALDGYWRHGGDQVRIMSDLIDKQEKNFSRIYPFPQSQDEPSEHN